MLSKPWGWTDRYWTSAPSRGPRHSNIPDSPLARGPLWSTGHCRPRPSPVSLPPGLRASPGQVLPSIAHHAPAPPCIRKADPFLEAACLWDVISGFWLSPASRRCRHDRRVGGRGQPGGFSRSLCLRRVSGSIQAPAQASGSSCRGAAAASSSLGPEVPHLSGSRLPARHFLSLNMEHDFGKTEE